MPINYKDYHPKWKEISKRTIESADNKCSLCGAPNNRIVFRPKREYLKHFWRPWFFDFERLIFRNPAKLRQTKIVLTVHHIDGDKANNSKHNLIALCQRCHLRLDLEKHISKRKGKANG